MARGWFYLGGDAWQPDLDPEANLTTAELLASAGTGSELTVLGVPEGSGFRMGIDRDRDGYRDGDEIIAGSDPGNPNSTPANVGVETGRGGAFALRWTARIRSASAPRSAFTLARDSRVDLAVYDVLGRQVRQLARALSFDAGAHSLALGRPARRRRPGRRGRLLRAPSRRGQQAIRPLVRIR